MILRNSAFSRKYTRKLIISRVCCRIALKFEYGTMETCTNVSFETFVYVHRNSHFWIMYFVFPLYYAIYSPDIWSPFLRVRPIGMSLFSYNAHPSSVLHKWHSFLYYYWHLPLPNFKFSWWNLRFFEKLSPRTEGRVRRTKKII